MKSWILAFTSFLITASICTASPQKGDLAQYKTTEVFDCGQQVETSKKSIEVLDTVADTKGNKYVHALTRTQVAEEPVASYESFLEASRFHDGRDVLTLEKLKNYCQSQKGLLENLKVPAGLFLTCAVSTDTDYGWKVTTWVGPVALGIVKRVAQVSQKQGAECLRKTQDELQAHNL